MNLDDVDRLAAADPGGMLRQVADLPRQLAQAGALAAPARKALAALPGRGRWTELLVCGMGGSAIGGDYAAAWAAPQGARVVVHRGYGVPPWARATALFVFSSYSGDTEETLAAFSAAPRDAARLCLTTGGELARLAAAEGVPVLPLPGGLQPRSALGHSLVALLWVLHAAGLLQESPAVALEAAARQLQALAPTFAPEKPEADNRAKQLARACAGHLVWIVSGQGLLEPAARRFKAQLHENAKTLAFASVVPEMNHNEIMAAPLPEAICSRTRLVCLADPEDPEPVRRRLRLTAELLSPHLAGAEWLESSGPERLGRLLGVTLLVDYTSLYTAFLHSVDPLPVQRIEQLKERLRRAP
ncbi:MAG TPA: bifunctional phosphoglucose/phosphomannose isomerase [Candidatus Krumholzibacteria bacterium]|nr:bifunctional phosphoglucose/phosphomannose isomerase [Candidatus Krumholzibacteria bacterium]